MVCQHEVRATISSTLIHTKTSDKGIVGPKYKGMHLCLLADFLSNEECVNPRQGFQEQGNASFMDQLYFLSLIFFFLMGEARI